jgi:MFS family permease
VLAPIKTSLTRTTAMRFVVLLGVVSLFADMTYEGARSVTGPYLAVLGASATVVGVVAGFGELIGYGLRLVSGYVSDRTGWYWLATILGYVVNLGAVPLLALAGRWEIAAGLMIAERVGKAIRTPARDAMLSHATHEIGRGFGFGLHEALDQTGAVLGPLLVAGVLATSRGYSVSFGVLVVPALLALTALFTARQLFPRPRDFEPAEITVSGSGLPRQFWLYLGAVALVAAGYADFPLIAYHFQRADVLPATWIPIFYAVAMGIDAVAALVCGRLFDRLGLPVLAGATLVSALFAPLVFFGGAAAALLGVTLWGIGMGAQESIMRAAVAGMSPSDRRGAAYGVFNTGFGVAWFAGSVLLGVLYDAAIPALVAVSVALQVAAIPLFFRLRRSRSVSAHA